MTPETRKFWPSRVSNSLRAMHLMVFRRVRELTVRLTKTCLGRFVNLRVATCRQVRQFSLS